MVDGLDPLQGNDSGVPKPVVPHRVSAKVQAGPGGRFVDGVLDSMIGRELPISGLPGGDAVGTLTGASVVDDGSALLLTFEVGEDVARRLSVVDSRDYSIRLADRSLKFTPLPARDAALAVDLDDTDTETSAELKRLDAENDQLWAKALGHALPPPVEDPHGDCDWGFCDFPAVTWRWHEQHGWMQVCVEHGDG